MFTDKKADVVNTNLTLLCRSKRLEEGEDPGQSFITTEAQNNVFWRRYR